MGSPLPYLPKTFRKVAAWLESRKFPSGIVIFAVGFLATAWFLIRVIPKPSRAQYPCMRACAPFMSGFVIQLIAFAGSSFAFMKFGQYNALKRRREAVLFLTLAVAAWLIAFSVPSRVLLALNPPENAAYYPPNAPIGNATGIFPGRVVWDWDSAATNYFCKNTSNYNGIIDPGDDQWFMLKNNNPAVIDSMVSLCMLRVSGKSSLTAAWDTLFRYYNYTHGHGNTPYQAGQNIFLKLNMTGAYGNVGNYFNADLSRRDMGQGDSMLTTVTNPYVVHSVIRQLVVYAGIPQNNIYVGDPMQNVFKEDYELWHGDFPGVHYLGNDLVHSGLQNIVGLGRTPVSKGNGIIHYSDNLTVMPSAGTDTLYNVFDLADYMINLPAMKAHACAGITLAAKNHWGSICRNNAWQLHDGIIGKYNDQPTRTQYGMYRAQTDMMEHNMLGGKTMLILVDALFCGDEAICTPKKWTSYPFNNNWASSLFVSQDPVALESVCFDFLRTEYDGQNGKVNRPNYGAVDDYLHQSADSSLWPAGIVYDPDRDGIVYASLGVHEHWNDSIHKQYSRDLGSGYGIELFKAFDPTAGSGNPSPVFNVSVYPCPATDHLMVSWQGSAPASFCITDLKGNTIFSLQPLSQNPCRIGLERLSPGLYVLEFFGRGQTRTYKFIKL
jgi:hypothetical protein